MVNRISHTTGKQDDLDDDFLNLDDLDEADFEKINRDPTKNDHYFFFPAELQQHVMAISVGLTSSSSTSLTLNGIS